MPLDSHSYLTAQGWAGKGTALREGAISRPLALTQKKTLSGLGKDRDEAFPFWDHLFTAAASAIKLKLDSDDEGDSSDASPDGVVTLARTKTGIISNRRPVAGTPIGTSGTSTPLSASENDTRARLSLLAAAKREAARARLYSRFFRGPVLGPYVEDDALAEAGSSTIVVATMVIEATTLEDGAPKEKKKRRRASDAEGDEEEVKAEMKRIKREAKAARKAERAERRANKEERRRRKAAEVEGNAADHESYPAPGRAERKGKGKDITVHGDAQAVERPSGGVKKRKGTQRAKADDGLGNEFINSRDSATSSPSTRTRSPREDVQEDYEGIDGLRDTTLDSSRQGDGKKRRRKRKESSMSST